VTLRLREKRWVNDDSDTEETCEEKVLRQSRVSVSGLFFKHPAKIS